MKDINNLQERFEANEREKTIQLLEKDKELQNIEIRRKEIIQYSLIGGFILVLILSFVLYKSYKRKQKDNKIIEKEKSKSDDLLLNILPLKVMEELKHNGKSNPENFDEVTVFFSDFVNFTNKSSKLRPDVLIEELSEIFTEFDNIFEKNGCERIKTIGDAYLGVCGMPQSNSKHANNIIDSALEIINYLEKRNKSSEIKWEARIGVHSGKVVGGIVGRKKYIYDVFGDTINTASRMESSSDAMKINISEATFTLVKNHYRFTDRGEINTKGKGLMQMYYVEGKTENNTIEINK